MGNFRFYRRLRILPGVSVNLSKSGPSLTMGVRGAHMTVGPRGVRRTVGIPRTGIYYTSQSGHHTGLHSAHVDPPSDTDRQAVPARMPVLAVLIAIAVALLVGVLIGSAFKGH